MIQSYLRINQATLCGAYPTKVWTSCHPYPIFRPKAALRGLRAEVIDTVAKNL